MASTSRAADTTSTTAPSGRVQDAAPGRTLDAGGRGRPIEPFATGPVLGIAAIAGASMLAFATRYGFHRDELYFIAGGDRPAAGYVDQPPLTPLVAKAADALFGHSLLGVRSLTAILVFAGVVGVGLIARELGGGRTAQVLAAFTVAAAPLLRAHNTFFGTTSLDQFMWLLALLAGARLLRTRDPRWWLAVGLAIGLGLETKATMVLLPAGLLVGVLVDRRNELLRSWWLVGGIAVAVAVWAPNLWWNATHEWAMVTFSQGKHSHIGDPVMYAYFIVGQILITGITTIFVWLPGWRWLFDRRGPGARFRALGIAAATAMGILFLMGAKYYYAGPVYLLLFPAGAVALEAGAARPRRLATWMVALSLVLCLPFTVPLFPTSDLERLAVFNRDYPSMVGWPELADQVREVVASLPEDERDDAVVFAVNYGEAGALEHFAPELPVYSGHNNYWMWGPPPDSATTAVLVGFDDEPPTGWCDAPERAGTTANDAGLDNFEAGRPIWVCHELTRPWSQIWPGQQQYT